MSRWWQTSGRTIEHEHADFAAAGLDFVLDDEFLAQHDVVVFRGRLRRGARTQPATVVYPPSYGEGEHPQVFAPEVPLGRHWRPEDGGLCLDHLYPGDDRPMTGVEAVLRAEELWRLVEEDPDELARVEVDAPFPVVDLYHYGEASLVYLLGADPGPHREGWMRLNASSLHPLRGAFTAIGGGLRGPELPLDGHPDALAGRTLLLGAWRRVGEPPPARSLDATVSWIKERHRDLVQYAIGLARGHRTIFGNSTTAFVGFVFPDEGPTRGETHDAWLLATIDLDNADGALARVVPLARDDLYLRQPGTRGLANRQVLLVGAGALGSQMGAMLARAGLGALDIIDPDVLDAGNVVRHELTLRDAGFPKAEALGAHLATLNPYLKTRVSWLRIGSIAGGLALADQAQKLHDEWAQKVAGAHLIINATAAAAPGRWLAALADALRAPVVHVAVSAGGWGARVHIQRPGVSGCPECLARHQADESGVVPAWSADPKGDAVVGRGCSQPTFAAPGFELTAAASAAVRAAVQVLLDGDGYPAIDYDVATLTFRDADRARPSVEYTRLPRHPACGCCGP
jgi:molybdopterin/thiamine biosynthesis adenylyltransferase